MKNKISGTSISKLFFFRNRKALLACSLILCTGVFGLLAWTANADVRSNDQSEKPHVSVRDGSFADGLGWLVNGNYNSLGLVKSGNGEKDSDGDDPDRVRFARGDFDEAEYLRLREEYIAVLRGVEPGKPFDFTARQRALKQMNRQKEEILQAAKNSSNIDASLVVPTWMPIGPNPIPNGQVTGALAVSGRVTAMVMDPTNTNKVYLGTAQGGLYRSLDGGTNWVQIFDSAATSAIGALALAPSNSTILYVGTGEANGSGDSYSGVGIYRIDNCDTAATLVGPINPVRNYNNASGNPVSAPVFNGRSISSIIVHPTNPSIVFAGIASGVIGIGAEPPLGNTTPPLGMRGLVRLTNATSTPTSVVAEKLTVTLSPGGFDLPNTGNRNVNAMFLDPADPNTLTVWINGNAAAGDGGIYRSTNAQAASPTFTQVLTTATSGARAEFAGYKEGANPAVIYAATGESSTGRLRQSVDGGATWSAAFASGAGFCGGQCFYNIGFDVRPGATTATTDDIVVLGGNVAGASTRLFAKSTNGAITFTESSSGLHADTHFIKIDPSNNNIIFHGNDGGVFKSINGGTSWATLNNTQINTVQFSGLAVHPTDANWSIGGTQDNGTNMRNSAGVWNRVDFGDGGYALIDRNAVNTTDITLYHTYFNQTNNLIGFGRILSSACAFDQNGAGLLGWSFKGIYGGLVDPTPHCDSTDTFNGIPISNAVLFYAPMELGPGNPNTVYFGAGAIYRSTNKGETMLAVSQSTTSPVSSIAVSPQDDNYRLFGRANGTVFYTTTGANPMTALAGIPAKFVGRAKFDPMNKNTAYITLGGYFGGTSTAESHVWKITNLNTGPVVTGINNGLPDVPVNAFAVDPANGNNLFAGTDIGVYSSTDGGATWAPFGTGLPSVAVFGMEIQPTASILRIATHGRGMWQIPTVVAPASISGAITYGNAIGSPAPPRFVKNVSVASVSGTPSVGPVITGTPGTYTLTGFGAGSYTIKPTKPGGANGAITSNDAARVAQGVSSAVPFVSQNQRFVADSSGNGTVSSNDAALIARFAAGLTGTGNVGQWKFFVTGAPSPLPTAPQTYNDSRTYASVASSLTGEDYVALLIGEASGNYNPATHPRPAGKVNSGQWTVNSEDGSEMEKPIAVTFRPVVTAAEKEIVVPVNVQGAAGKDIISYEFDLRYDPSVIQPSADAVDVAGTASRGLSVVANPYEPGLLRVVVYGALPIEENGVLLNLRFTAVGAAGSVSLLTWERIIFNEGLPITSADGQVKLF